MRHQVQDPMSAGLDKDISPSTLRSIQKIASWSPMASLAATTERRLRGGEAVDIRASVAAYYPMGFIKSTSISMAVLRWLFPPRGAAVVDKTIEASPLGPFTQRCVLVDLVRLMSAIGCHEVLEMLLETPAFADDSEAMTATERQSILDEALRCATHETAICLLLAHGADPQTMKNGFTRSPNKKAAFCSSLAPHIGHGLFTVGDNQLLATYLRCAPYVNLVKELLHAGVDPSGVDDHANATFWIMTHTAVDVDRRFPDGRTALIEAVAWNRPGAAEALIALGADVNARGQNNETALCRAIGNSNTAHIELLLKHGADPRLCEDGGSSPLHEACRRDLPFTCLELLLERGADPNLRDGQGQTPLDVLKAARKYHHYGANEGIESLIAYGADTRRRKRQCRHSS